MNRPLLSVCLITYNQVAYIKQAIDSVLMQETDFTWNLVIADDYSTDGTREILIDYKNKYPEQIKLILQKKNVGAEKNWLELINYPRSKYIAYLDGDDYWTDPHKLQIQVNFLEKNLTYALCFHLTKVFFEHTEGQEAIWPVISDKNKITVKELLQENFIPSNSVVYRRQNYEAIPSGLIPGDWYMHLYHAQFGKIGFIDEVMSAYRRHEGSLWWDSQRDIVKHWQSYGIGHIALFIELIKLYGNDKDLVAIIGNSLRAVVETLLSVEKVLAKEVVTYLCSQSPDLLVMVITSQQKEVELRVKLFEEQSTKLEMTNQEILTLRADLFKARDELFNVRDEVNALKNSRVLGRIMKVRDYIGEQRPKVASVPKRTLHGVRVIGAPLVPAPVRRKIKTVYKNSKSINTFTKEQLASNDIWSKSLPLVSVVIPYYNRADTIDDTLRSLRSQTFTNFETILVDDGSPDLDSIEKLKDIEKNSPQISVIRQKNQGVAAARNNGIKQARGKYVVCLDSDDMLDPTYLEKAVILLETQPDVAIATTWMDMFGIKKERFKNVSYDPLQLYKDNMVITAAMFRKQAWEVAGGYKPKIGYEDWDFWLSLGENGFWGRLIPEALFQYRTSMQSRYVDDKDVHWSNLQSIRELHPKYRASINGLMAQRQAVKQVIDTDTAFINISNIISFLPAPSDKPNVLITIPWMTFGGAETLIYNYCREIKDDINITFVTGLQSEHEWEYKFKEITPNVYHLANLFDDENLYIEFLANYIHTRNISLLHIIHNGFTFKMLSELKKRFPKLRVSVTMFNDRVEYFEQSIEHQEYIDSYVSDNEKVAKNYRQRIGPESHVTVIPNGINCYDEFSPKLYDRAKERTNLGIEEGDIAVLFVGRLSVEKNPNIIIQVAEKLLTRDKHSNLKFFLIGDGPMREEIETMIQKVDDTRINYLGYQSEIARFLSAADIFILPSSIEGFPLSILEAMAMRVAVVASDVGAVAEVVESGKEGFVVKPGDVEEIAEAVTILSKNREMLAEVKDSARRKVETKYSNRILGKNYRALYNKLLG